MTKKGRVENLRVPTSEEARQNGRAGGIASGEARRAKKAWKEIANIMLDHPTSKTNAAKLSTLGIEQEDATNAAVILCNLVTRATKGDMSAIQMLAKITGNMEPDKIEVNAPIKFVVKDEYGSDEEYEHHSDGDTEAGDQRND